MQEDFPEDRLPILSTDIIDSDNHGYDALNFEVADIERRIQFLDEIYRNEHQVRDHGRNYRDFSDSRERVSERSDSLRAALNWGQPFERENERVHLLSLLPVSLESSIIHEPSLRIPSPTHFPPASPQVIRKLSTITIAPHHVCDDKECSICFKEFLFEMKVVRLPCGHLFHRNCIQKWLRQKCTCPVCRWELATSDSIFEHGRVARMRRRKIRVNVLDLEQMKMDELLALVETHGNNNHTVPVQKNKADRSHLINEIKKSSRVRLIDTSREGWKPDPKNESTLN